MKIEIEKKDLLTLVGKTQNIVEKKNTMPVLVNVLLEAEDGKLKVFATDLEVSLTDAIACKVITPGKLAANAKSLFEIVRELADGKLMLTRKENNWLQIKQGKFVSNIVGLGAEEYPIFPTYSGDNFAKIDSGDLKEMIEKTLYSVSTDESRYYLNGVFFEPRGEEGYMMVATDGHRLSLIRKKLPSAKIFSLDQGVIIPRKGLHEVKKLLESLGGEFEIAIEGSQLILRSQSTTLLIRLIEGKYLNYNQFIPQKLKQRLILNREAFLGSIRRVVPLANQKSKAITFALSDGKMEITSNNPDLGDAHEEVEIDYHGQDIKISFNAKYITDILTAMSDEEVDFEINDQLSPGIMKPHNSLDYTCVVMPMRI